MEKKILQRSQASNFYQPHNRNPVNFCYITFSRTVVVVHVFLSVWPLVARSRKDHGNRTVASPSESLTPVTARDSVMNGTQNMDQYS